MDYAYRREKAGRPARMVLTQPQRMAVHLARMIRYADRGYRPLSDVKRTQYMRYIKQNYPYNKDWEKIPVKDDGKMDRDAFIKMLLSANDDAKLTVH